MIILGYLLMTLALGWFVYKVYVSFNSSGGTDFEMPVYDGAVYPPLLTVVGLYLTLPAWGVTWSIWLYVGLWLALTAIAAGIIRVSEEFGDRSL